MTAILVRDGAAALLSLGTFGRLRLRVAASCRVSGEGPPYGARE